jgi:small secreted domain DUF320
LRKFFAAVLATTTLSLMGAASASAQPEQNGLVNINISGNTVQVPIGIAANVCDVNVAILVDDFLDAAEPCRADATSTAEVFVETPDGGQQGPGFQTGLINLNISDNQVQIPLAAALNVCDVNVAVLVDIFDDAAAECEARARGRARSSS